MLKTVALRGFARGGLFDDVLKLEMTFENADNSWAGNDYRNVDMEVISPSGFSCTKPIPQFQSDGQGGFVVVGNPEDPCLTWNSFQREGTVDWIALGQYEEPERVLLFGLGQELANGQDFTVRLHYVEDCANIRRDCWLICWALVPAHCLASSVVRLVCPFPCRPIKSAT